MRSAALLAVLSLAPCLAFAPPAPPGNHVQSRDAAAAIASRRSPPPLSSTAESISSSFQQLLPAQLEKLEVIKLALKRPRGASVGLEYVPEVDISDGDLSIVSMQLRKAKCAAVWTSDAESAGKIAREQEGSRGEFPGPVPVIYSGLELQSAADCGATAVVVECGRDVVEIESMEGVGIIWKVNTMEQLQELASDEADSGGVYLLSNELLPASVEEDASALKESLSNLPKSVVTIAPLPTMQPKNGEISLGKHYASLGVSSLLLQRACIGDEEDVKYSQFAIESINKKSSSSFSMTGLTGSTNGHFGVSSHSGEVKWRRVE